MTVDMAGHDQDCPNCGSRARMPDGRCADCAADLKGVCPFCQIPILRLAFFCSHCGAALGTTTDEVREPVTERALSRRPVTVMFCDLVGSVALSTGMDAEDFSELLEKCHSIVTSIVSAHHGFVARYMGDGTLAYFGYPQSGEEDAERAIQAALAVLRAIPDVVVSGAPMQARIGIATGVVVVGGIVAGRGTRGLDVAGEVPNLAARLQAAAAPDSLLIDLATYRLVADRFNISFTGDVDLKGWAAPVPAWQVLHHVAPAQRDDKAAHAKPLFIGREAEMSRLLAAWRAAGPGRGAAVVVSGEMGIGKSRLVAEFVKRLDGVPRIIRRWYGSRYLQGAALHPIVTEIEMRAGIVAEDKQAERREKLEGFFATAPALDRALIIELMAPGIAATSIAGLSPNRRREMTLQALLNLIQTDSDTNGLIAIFEDYHWADPTSRDWLALLIRSAATLNLLLVVTVRSGEEPEWSGDENISRIDLDMLGPAHAARMVAAVAGRQSLPETVTAEILARCDGVPLFLEEVTRAVIASPAASLRAPVMPALPLTIHGSLLARLDRLGDARETAQAAAIIGREFTAALLARVAFRPEQTIQQDLQKMAAAGLIQDAGAGTFRFRHALVQDAAYDSLLRQQRRVLHGKVGNALREFSPAVAETQPQLLAIHFTEAGNAMEAVSWWRAAALRSLQQSAMTEGLEQLKHGLDLLETLPDTPARRELELDLLICSAKAHVATSGHASDKVEASLRRARDLSRSLAGMPQLLTATFGQWAHYVTRGPLTEAARLSGEIGAMAQASGNKVIAMFSSYTSGMTRAMMGDFAQAVPILQQGIAACAELDPAIYLAPATGDPKAVMRSFLSMVETHQGRQAESARSIALALREAQESKLSYSIALAMLVKVTNESFGGAPGGGFGDLDALRDFARSRGMEFFEALEYPLRGWLVARRGDTEAGLAMLRDGLERYRSTQSRVWIYTFLRMQAEILGWRGEAEAGIAVLDAAEAASESVDTAYEASIAARARGELLSRTGNIAAARAAFDRAERLAMQSGARLHAVQARIARARCLEPAE